MRERHVKALFGRLNPSRIIRESSDFAICIHVQICDLPPSVPATATGTGTATCRPHILSASDMERLTIPSNLMRSNSETSVELARDSARQLQLAVRQNRYTRRVAATTTFATACSFVTFVVLTVSIATDYWIVVHGSYRNATDNRIICNHTFLIGLWRKCRRDFVTVLATNNATSRSTDEFEIGTQNCTMIDYATVDEAAPSEGFLRAVGYFTGELSHGSTANSGINMKMSSWAFLSGMILLATSSLLCLISMCDHDSARITTILSGVILILSGVGDMCGLIIYIQSASSELVPRTKQKEHSDSFDMTYRFSFSFAMAVCTFFCAELTGVFCLYIYVKHYRHIIALRLMQPATQPSTQNQNQNANLHPCATTTYHNRGWIRPYAVREFCNYHNRDPRSMMDDIKSIVGDNVHIQTGKRLANSKLSNHSIADSVRPQDGCDERDHSHTHDSAHRFGQRASRSLNTAKVVRNGAERCIRYAYNSACNCEVSENVTRCGRYTRNGHTYDFYDLSQHQHQHQHQQNPVYEVSVSRPPSHFLRGPYRKTTIV